MIDPRRPDFRSTPVAPDRAGFGYAPVREHVPGRLALPAVTVVTPYFNTGHIVHETARCVLGQSLQNFEWIIVNDASSSPVALDALQRYRRGDDPRIRVLDHTANQGLPAARNTGIRAARAPFVFFLDSDDLIEPTTLEKCALALACNPEFAFAKGYSVGFGAQEYLWPKGFHDGPVALEENRVTATTMVRTSVCHAVGLFDESIRGGLEDWEFWLRCAAHGHWGYTVPEYLDWYRRRENQHAVWDNLAHADRRDQFLAGVRRRFPDLFEPGNFPAPSMGWQMPFSDIPVDPPLHNPLTKARPRLLLVAPWLRMGGADRFNLDALRYLTVRADWQTTVATTLSGHPWLPEFTRLTPDVFALDHLARPPQYPRLLSHLIASRRPDVVMISNAQHGYACLPYLRAAHPDVTFVDFNHMEEPHWLNGGHPRTGAGYQEQLDLSMVVSGHLKDWMTQRGADPERVEVCHINADSTTFRPDAKARAAAREELGLGSDQTVILYACRLCPQKQPLMFGQSIAELAKRTDAFTALVAGDGELEFPLREFVDREGLSERVRFLGPVPAAKMPGLMAASDIFFLPSLWEGIALSIYEAMSAGLAVVGADVGGQAELVTPETGILLKRPAPPGSASEEARAYADALEALILDPERTRALGAAARARIQEHFELDTMGRRLLGLLDHARELHDRFPRQLITPGFARELALQGIEMVRVHELADHLWPYRSKWLDREAQERHDHEQARRADLERREHALEIVTRIESSRGYRLVSSAKNTWAYRVYAKARWGEGWEVHVRHPDPVHRLNVITASRTYKLIKTLGGGSNGHSAR